MMDELSESQALRIAALEAELAAARAELQDFTSTVSHDLRAPLRHIVSYIQLVQEDAGPQLSAEVQGFLHTVTGSAKQLGTMLDALLQLSRVGSVALNLQPVSLPTVLESVSPAATAGLHFDANQDHVQRKVLADPVLLRMALEQVLDNARKFTRNRAQAEISLSVTRGGNAVQWVVQDNGVGFDPAQAVKLCQPFVRLHSQRQFEGLGMGLAMARKALQRMGGSLHMRAQVDGGCCVTLALPAAH